MRTFKRLAFIILLMVGLAGCASTELNVAPVSISDNPTTKIAELEAALDKGRADQVNVLSPTWYAKAETYLEKSRAGLASNDSVEKVLQNIAYGQANLDKAREYTLIARSSIAHAIKARDLAYAAGAGVFGGDYQRAEADFITLTTDIENDNQSRAEKNEGKVAQAFADLELRAIKENTLGEVRKLLATAEKDGAKMTAPKTYNDVKKTLDEVDLFISHQRHQDERIQEKTNQLLFQAQRLKQIMAVSLQVKKMKPEDITLWNEDHLYQITSKLEARDLRNESPELQLQNIIESVASLQADNLYLKEKRQQETADHETSIKQLQAELDAKDQQIALLEGESKEAQRERELIALQEKETKARLEAERRFQQLFNEVQGLFDQGQAEVYKQSGNLVIRLKTMQFPIGKNLIMPDNYALLSKVRNAIRTFGDPTVVIEGHTDSTGSAAINEKLSKDRAEAVRQYFIANGTLAEDDVTSIGFGPDRPLATNNTTEGRAINRRIDVIIKPRTAPR